MEAFADVLAEEVAGDMLVEAVQRAEDSGVGLREGFVVADVGDDDVVGGKGGESGSFDELLLKAVSVGMLFGGDVDTVGREMLQETLFFRQHFRGKQIRFIENQKHFLSLGFRENLSC